MKKSISSLLSLSLLMTACAPQKSETYKIETIREIPAPVAMAKSLSLDEEYRTFKKLLSGSSSNMAMAEIKAFEVMQKNPGMRTKVSASEADLLSWAQTYSDLQNNWRARQWNVLQGKGLNVQNDAFKEGTAFAQKDGMETQGSFDTRAKLEMAIYINNEMVSRIFDIYNRQLAQNSRELAREMVASWNRDQKDLIARIDAIVEPDTQVKAQKILKEMIKWDRRLAAYNLPDEDNAKLVIYSLVAAQLVEVLKTNTTVRQLLNVIGEVKEVYKKTQEVLILVNSINKYRQAIKKDWSEMGDSFRSMVMSLNHYRDQLNPKNMALSPQARESLTDLMDDVLKGQVKVSKKSQDKSFLLAEFPVEKNFIEFVDSAGRVANSAEGLIDITEALASAMNVQLSDDVKRVLETGRRVAQTIQVGKAVVSAFQAQGLVGAVGVFSGAGGAALLVGGAMGGGNNAQVMSALKAIKQDLKEIKEMQARILENQLATMEALKEMSIMINEYHRQTMSAFDLLTNEVLVNREMAMNASMESLNVCRGLLSTSKSLSQEMNPLFAGGSILTAEATKAQLFNGWSLLSQNMNSVLWGNQITECHKAMQKSFGKSVTTGSPLLFRFDGRLSESHALKTEMRLYWPALRFLQAELRNNNWEELALHLPAAHMQSFSHYKVPLLSMGSMSSIRNFSDLNDLISPRSLEPYAVTLLEMHILLGGNTETRFTEAREWLSMALKKTNVAIAQFAILSGEPLLPFLNKYWNQIVMSSDNCQTAYESEKWNATFCFAQENPVMLRNLLKYRFYLLNGRDAVAEYNDSLHFKSTESVARMLGLPRERIALNDKKEVILKIGVMNAQGKTLVLAPLDDSLNIQYDSAMLNLLKLQEKLSQELVRVSPQYLTDEQTDMLAKSLLRKAM
ncbi:hypothetical protein D3C87_241370 [compost metagenome]